MKNTTAQNWYVVGYLRTVPDERTFVFPIVQNADVAEGRAYYSLNGTALEFVEPDSQEEIIRIIPIEIPRTVELQDALPLYGYEFESGRVWIGDARQLSKVLIDFACGTESLTARARREISSFIERVVARSEYIAKNTILLQGQATISESERKPQFDEYPERTRIKIIGVGGGGCNAVARMIQCDVSGAEFICANTDALALSRSAARRQIQLGQSGLGAGGNPERGKAAAEASVDEIKAAIHGAHLLFITAGLGGGTGTGAAPVIARLAREMGIMTVGVVTKPFEFEGNRRMINANVGVSELEANVDSLIVVSNEKLLESIGGEVSQSEVFAHANDVLTNAVVGITGIINVPGHVNVDFEDVCFVMRVAGKAMIGMADASGPDRARFAAEQAAACPLFEGVGLSGAKGLLMVITAAKGSLKLSDSKLAMNTIRAYASPDAHVIYGTAYDDSLGESIRVTVLATGLPSQTDRHIAYRLQELRTGTESLPFHVPVLNAPSSVFDAVTTPRITDGSLAQADYGVMATPSPWRTKRTKAVPKADARSNSVMDDYELPAFLRKQGD